MLTPEQWAKVPEKTKRKWHLMAEAKKVPEIWGTPRESKPHYAPNAERKLKVSNEYWTAFATWTRRDGIWFCSQADTVIGWMKKLDPEKAKLEVARLGAKWEWMINENTQRETHLEWEERRAKNGIPPNPD